MRKGMFVCTIVLIVLAVKWLSSQNSISYLHPDGSGAREYVRLQDVIAGATTYYAFWIDGTRWVLTGEGAVSCDAPATSLAWAALIEEQRQEILKACSWQWTKWAFAEAMPTLDEGARSWGLLEHLRSLQTVTCDKLHEADLSEERKRWIGEWCNEPERVYNP